MSKQSYGDRPPTWLELESIEPMRKVEKITNSRSRHHQATLLGSRCPTERPTPGHEVETRPGDHRRQITPKMEKPPAVSGGFSFRVSWNPVFGAPDREG